MSERDDNDNDKSYSDDSDSDTESKPNSDSESEPNKSEPNKQPDADNEIGLIDDSYMGRDSEPKQFKLDAIKEELEIKIYPDHQPNPTVVIEENVEATVDTATLNVEPPVELRQSTRERSKPKQYGFAHLEHCHNMVTIDDAIEYDPVIAGVVAQFIHEVNEVARMNGHQFGQQYIVHKGLKKFGKKGKIATLKELCQLHDRV